jgi:hypothetical protein
VIDGVDGRTHHVRFADLDATGDASPGGIVELRRFLGADGRPRLVLAVRSDLPIEEQVHARGATWLDRQLVTRDPVTLSPEAFGRDVRGAMADRLEHLIGQGLATRQGQRVIGRKAPMPKIVRSACLACSSDCLTSIAAQTRSGHATMQSSC